MKYANGKEAKTGDQVVGRDIGGNLVVGVLVTFLGDALARLVGVPMPVPGDTALCVEDAYGMATAPAAPVSDLRKELLTWLDGQKITSENIGNIRRQASLPWDSEWNSFVRDETAARENALPAGRPIEPEPPAKDKPAEETEPAPENSPSPSLGIGEHQFAATGVAPEPAPGGQAGEATPEPNAS